MKVIGINPTPLAISDLNTDKYAELSAVIDGDSFFYGLWDESQNLIGTDINRGIFPFFEQIPSQITKMQFGVLNNIFSVVPEKIFDPSLAELFVSHANGVAKIDQHIFRSDYVTRFNVRVVYAVRSLVIKQLNNRFSKPSCVHLTTAFLESLVTLTFDYKIHLMLHNEKALLCLTKGEELLLVNVFPVLQPSDLLYFTSLICQRFELAQAKIPIQVSGMVNEGDEQLVTLGTYFGNIRLRELPIQGPVKNAHCDHALYSVRKCA